MITKESIAALRREFDAMPLEVDKLPENPYQLFDHWFSQAIEAQIDDPTACVLATVDETGAPDTRVILLKDFSRESFIFYTNYHSTKAQQINSHVQVALNFYWPSLFRQIRIRGGVTKVSPEESEKYFHSRPRDSQIAAYASRQSEVTTRAFLEAAFEKYKQKFSSDEIIPYPKFWGGYCVKPTEIEFWHGRHHRLHDRVHYARQTEGWIKRVLGP